MTTFIIFINAEGASPEIAVLIALVIILILTLPPILTAINLENKMEVKGTLFIVYAIIAALLYNFVSAILWFIVAISLFIRKKSLSAENTVAVQSHKGASKQEIRYKLVYKSVSIKHSDDSIKVAHTVGNKKLIDDKTIDIHLDSSEILKKISTDANQASHKDTCKKELDSQDMIEHPEFKNPTTKNLEGLNEEVHKDEATTKVDSDNTESPIESKDHVSKKD
ncbi:MFS transporter [Staphylococcus aureus]|nr:MFS transporter [Staphylococcus aureus]